LAVSFNFLQHGSALPVMVTGKWSAYVYLNPWAFSSYFLHLLCWGRGVREWLERC